MEYEYMAIVYTMTEQHSYNLLLQNGWEPVRETSDGYPYYGSRWLCILRKPKALDTASPVV